MKTNGKRFCWAEEGVKQGSIFFFKVDGPQTGGTLNCENIEKNTIFKILTFFYDFFFGVYSLNSN